MNKESIMLIARKKNNLKQDIYERNWNYVNSGNRK